MPQKAVRHTSHRPSDHRRSTAGPTLWAGVALVVAVVVFRLVAAVGLPGSAVAGWSNFSPMAAVVLCAAAFFPRLLAVWVPAAALLVSDAVLNIYYGAPPFGAGTAGLAVAYGLVFAVGSALRRGLAGARAASPAAAAGVVLGGAVVSSLVFYLVTNTVAFLGSAAYPQNLAGWWQALTVGVPGFPPTLVFLRNSLLGDVLFTGAFLLVLRPFRRPLGSEAPGPLPAAAPPQ
jgi:hypothetical protein